MLFTTLIVVAAVTAPSFEVATLSGDSFEGTITSLTNEQLTLANPDGIERVIAVDELLKVSAQSTKNAAPTPTSGRLRLVDGTELSADQFALKSGTATFVLPGLGGVEGGPGHRMLVPASAVDFVVFKRQDENLLKRWKAIQSEEHEGDALVVRKRVNTDDGKQVEVLDYLDGVVRGVTSEQVGFEFDGDLVNVPRSRVEGLIFLHARKRELPDALCGVTDAAGNQWNARAIALAAVDSPAGDVRQLSIQTQSGVSADIALSDVRKIDFSFGKLVFLSDIEPTAFRWEPYIASGMPDELMEKLFQPKFDQSGAGQPLQLRVPSQRGRWTVQSYRKGISLHSRSSLVYTLGGKYSKFKAVCGIDASVRDRGHVRLVCSGDGKTLFDQPITGNAAPVQLDLDVTGVQRLRILVDFGDEMDLADQLNLCQARLIK